MSNPNERTRRSRSHNAIDRLRRVAISCQAANPTVDYRHVAIAKFLEVELE